MLDWARPGAGCDADGKFINETRCAVSRDDVTGDLYASSDFGVMKLPSGSTTWVVAGAGLPMVEVSGLTISSSARVLYAATHGRSAWSLQLP